jgi:hypothetical protein
MSSKSKSKMAYSVVSKDSLSDEYGPLGASDIEDPGPPDRDLSLAMMLSEEDKEDDEDDEEDEEEDDPCSTMSLCYEYATMANIIGFIVLVELVVFTYWITSYHYVYEYPDSQGSWVGLDDGDSDYSSLSASLSHWTEHPAGRYNNTTYVGKSADEFVEFIGVTLFIYLCIRCTCGRDPYRK